MQRYIERISPILAWPCSLCHILFTTSHQLSLLAYQIGHHTPHNCTRRERHHYSIQASNLHKAARIGHFGCTERTFTQMDFNRSYVIRYEEPFTIHTQLHPTGTKTPVDLCKQRSMQLLEVCKAILTDFALIEMCSRRR